MKKEILLGAMLMVFLSGYAVAQVVKPLPDLDSEITMEAAQKAALETVNLISDINISATICDGSTCTFRLFKEGAIDTSMRIPWNESRKVMEESRDAAIKRRLEGIAEATIKRQSVNRTAVIGPGRLDVR